MSTTGPGRYCLLTLIIAPSNIVPDSHICDSVTLRSVSLKPHDRKASRALFIFTILGIVFDFICKGVYSGRGGSSFQII